MWPTGCFEIITDPAGSYGDITATCAEAIANCQTNGQMSQTYDCSDVVNVKVEYCYWEAGKCYPMNNPDWPSADNPGMTNKEVCVTYARVSQLEDCSDVASVRAEYYCYWGEGGCQPMYNPGAYDPNNYGMTIKQNCEAYGKVSQLEDCSDVSSINGGGDGETSCNGYCKWETTGCVKLKINANNLPEPITDCNAARAHCQIYGQLFSDDRCTEPVSVRLTAGKAAATGLRVSYAKNRVIVNWTPATKVSSGTVQLINMKGAALSTAFIKANSGKVSVRLGTVGVPAGMYFVHINAVGQNGKKIVAQSAVSVVK